MARWYQVGNDSIKLGKNVLAGFSNPSANYIFRVANDMTASFNGLLWLGLQQNVNDPYLGNTEYVPYVWELQFNNQSFTIPSALAGNIIYYCPKHSPLAGINLKAFVYY